MSTIKKINHIAIAVQDINQALTFWEEALGLKLDRVENVPSQKSKVAFLPIGDGEVELVQPSDAESGLAKFLQEKGEGMHHLCIEVENLEQTLKELKTKGICLIDENPRTLPGRKMAFIHPRSATGVLVELYQVTE